MELDNDNEKSDEERSKESDEESSDEESSKESDEENIEKSAEESETELDSKDLQGASLDDALDTIEGKNRPENIAEWPNDAYREFMELIVKGNISNKIGDKIIKFFNTHSSLKKSPLPKSTKAGKNYLNQINSPCINFKEKVVTTYSGIELKLYYRPIFRTIQALLQ